MNEIVDYYNAIAIEYNDSRFNNTYGVFIDTQEQAILNRLLGSNTTEKIIVDAACGTGRLLHFANVGVDASENMLTFARQRFPNKQLILCDAANIPIENNSVDCILAFHFFMHLNQEKMDAIVNEFNRILKPNGKLIFDMPSKYRRLLLGHKPNNWHGANSINLADVQQLKNYTLKRYFGLLFFPIHQFPSAWRKYFVKIDLFLANSILKKYSSYLIFEMAKT